MQPVVLRTERLELSVPVLSDVDAIHAACQDAGIRRFVTVPSPYEREHAVGFIGFAAGSWEKDTEFTWAVRNDGGLIGMIGVVRKDPGAAELGYWIAAEHRGRGFLTEAARAVIDWSLSPEGLDVARLEWRALVGNVASARAARKLGFRYEGLLRKGLVHRGVREDAWIAAVLADDDRMPRPWPMLED